MLTKSDIQTLKNAGYEIYVSYTSTVNKSADVNINSLINAEDDDDLNFDNDKIEDETFDEGSASYSIWEKPDNNGIQHCVADYLTDYNELEDAIHQIFNNLKKEG